MMGQGSRGWFGGFNKNTFIKWVGSGNGGRPAGQVRAQRNLP